MKKILAMLLVLSVALMGFAVLAEEETSPSSGTGSATEESSSGGTESGGTGDTDNSGENTSGETGGKEGESDSGNDGDWSFEDPTDDTKDDTKKDEDSGSSSNSGKKTNTRKENQTADTDEKEETSSREDDSLLRRGSRGDRVRQLQRKLIELGYYEGSVDGSFGPMTEDAVLKYQKDYGLDETGTLTEEQFDALLQIEKPAEEIEAEATEIPAVIEVVDAEVNGINILKKTEAPQLGEVSSYEEGIWRYASGGTGTREVADIEDAPVSGIVKGIRITDDGSSAAFSDVAIDAVPTEYKHIYVFSCYAKGEGKIRLEIGRDPWPATQFEVTSDWAQYSFPFVADEEIGSTAESPVTNVYVGIVAGLAGDVTFCGMQLEEVQAHTWSGNNG